MPTRLRGRLDKLEQQAEPNASIAAAIVAAEQRGVEIEETLDCLSETEMATLAMDNAQSVDLRREALRRLARAYASREGDRYRAVLQAIEDALWRPPTDLQRAISERHLGLR